MPNVSFDIFFDKDFINITATRGHTAPKAKPEWKVRTAPKLPPKPQPEDHSGTPRPPPREKLTSTRQSLAPRRQLPEKAVDNTDAVSQTRTVATAGAFAGGAVSAVGNSINGIGEGINNSIRRYGDGAKDYGNAIMDWTAADGVRATTANNPLGLSAGKTGGKRTVTHPTLYTPPKPSPSKTLMTTNKSAQPQKKIEAGTPKKALPAPGPGPKPPGAAKKVTTNGAAPVKKAGVSVPPPSTNKTSTAPNPGAFRKKPAENNTMGNAKKASMNAAAKKPVSVQKSTPIKPSQSKKTSAPRTNYVAAANPLGLKF
ncbi:hypothetical protein PV08_07482 [Exophiala spinifera]|uniref:Uncharacterized protein n=1 Tax=Exophiala spinifera TaxID=91928 RepID=A0A0D2B6Z7_9EURO|nr:uncharacterized protein PV08_07482 [Exophiala spinifera]KIW14698.1 hypothetical protein PV08_07482 [Exophiala spinifera]